ncbi:hypothetical protein PUNSTDRAFT_98678 [Punctularia strigosozonata HHB-11173 SS5]|uniref:uncharacterized protein n=1 Tax=Punctularia strigosozonata (strain HHB-11173) TaxID=741275 RepID=UPI000441750E|nr:uncharacterized protein PUNSTDRAFT_98678 [Punctularia strigosozonata HHB-11173 SS5]EIN11544.1 hypothetical protein PUNSTDRAFT_98678 [Punctularia strigosozonata HHB-11173 SS5]
MSENERTSLPLIADLLSNPTNNAPALAQTLAILFEPTPVLYSHLLPQLVTYLNAFRITTYSELIDASVSIIQSWDCGLQAQFIAGHPRIGEVGGLSKLSAAEQATKATSPAVLARLAHLNACYEHVYPGLRYITFVNGRTRAEVLEEMEAALGLRHSLLPDQPPIAELQVVSTDSNEWVSEMQRAVVDVGRIAKSRASSLGGQ